MLVEDYVRQLQDKDLEDSYELLTMREREILQLIAEGKSNKEVSAQLNISVRTVENHRARIMRKLRLRSFSSLVRYAIRNKIVEA